MTKGATLFDAVLNRLKRLLMMMKSLNSTSRTSHL